MRDKHIAGLRGKSVEQLVAVAEEAQRWGRLAMENGLRDEAHQEYEKVSACLIVLREMGKPHRVAGNEGIVPKE
jgi:hypothetical protein